ncbi:hypothetical protein [Paraburkholderia acidipaludis]|uniref:hypothetical protein n=1 Tax=Paraburkholderia acidipaludis TaxID=660537 RepID=UPI0012ECB598|nr:hypothetical protein [Paraburkholderia acidipaludis]
MKSMTLLILGSMGSLTALALIAALSCGVAAAQPPQHNAGAWNLPRAGARPPERAPQPGGANPAVPRGDLRADITDNARQRAMPPREEMPAPPRR